MDPQDQAQLDAVALALDVLPRLARLMQQATAATTGEGLSLTQFRLLKWIDLGCCQTGQLAEQLDLSAATVSASMDVLVQRGLVIRLSHAQDRRVIPLQLTPSGQQALAEARERQRIALAALFDQIPASATDALAIGFVGVRDALEQRDPGARR